ncbi:methyltransferase family protein [Undibacterium sp.]|jgi:protein-S-isoprenylcysteine O-methyltransferase Ste14|uniref:methyltransferase family protein n=1 Tax=Undibacterium sp. TaxID=1914977 RepID=UPI002B810CBF|nr:DUF1295 domain-containing protein [Undibacterium sp.]HTD06241.1 DUF1295 domain-containing protein [Undibacterium sp.]
MNTLAMQNSSARVLQLAANYFSTVAVFYLGYLFFTQYNDYFIRTFFAVWTPTLYERTDIVVSTELALRYLFLSYAVLLVPYYAYYRDKRSASLIALAWLYGRIVGSRAQLEHVHKQAFLYLLLKAVFVPFIFSATISQLVGFNNALIKIVLASETLQAEPWMYVYMSYVHDLLMHGLFLLDVLPFVFGYLLDAPFLKNTIKSVDPTFSGWFFCLCCYQPFNYAAFAFFPRLSTESFNGLELFGYPLTVAMDVILLVALAGYASASWSLGLKASNLTSRGVVRSGLYRWIRHPAYSLKLAAWWISVVPLIAGAYISGGNWFMIALGMSVWTMVYYFRAVTEERHLRYTDAEYAEYCKVVSFRFIPNII